MAQSLASSLEDAFAALEHEKQAEAPQHFLGHYLLSPQAEKALMAGVDFRKISNFTELLMQGLRLRAKKQRPILQLVFDEDELPESGEHVRAEEHRFAEDVLELDWSEFAANADPDVTPQAPEVMNVQELFHAAAVAEKAANLDDHSLTPDLGKAEVADKSTLKTRLLYKDLAKLTYLLLETGMDLDPIINLAQQYQQEQQLSYPQLVGLCADLFRAVAVRFFHQIHHQSSSFQDSLDGFVAQQVKKVEGLMAYGDVFREQLEAQMAHVFVAYKELTMLPDSQQVYDKFLDSQSLEKLA